MIRHVNVLVHPMQMCAIQNFSTGMKLHVSVNVNKICRIILVLKTMYGTVIPVNAFALPNVMIDKTLMLLAVVAHAEESITKDVIERGN